MKQNTQIVEVIDIPICIRYDLTVEELVDLGRYDIAERDWINSREFPRTKTTPEEVMAKLVRFQSRLDKNDMIQQLDMADLVPGDNHGLLSLGAQHPDEQRKHPIGQIDSECLISWLREVSDKRYAQWGIKNTLPNYYFILAYPK